MLSIEMEGARSLLKILQRVRDGNSIPEETIQNVLDSNSFFVDFYCQWEGVNREIIAGLVRCFDRPDQVPTGMLTSRLAEGFRQALDEIDLVQDRLAWASQVDVSAVAGRVLAYLPANTPIDSAVHLTVDLANNAFVHKGEMGVSLLSGMDDRKTFEEAVLDKSLEPGAEFDACLETAGKVAFDMEKMLLPAGHYLGARMVQTIERAFPRQRVIDCIQNLSEFLTLYNEAARKTGGFVFDAQKTAEFARLWD